MSTPVEIERKFLVANDKWRGRVTEAFDVTQAYLSISPSCTVRVRTERGKGILTIKGKAVGITRAEYEYEIPLQQAEELLSLRQGDIVCKRRHLVEGNRPQGDTWEVDVFSGNNEGLVIAEIELSSEEQLVSLPEWLGGEVTHDSRYTNACLALNPFRHWQLTCHWSWSRAGYWYTSCLGKFIGEASQCPRCGRQVITGMRSEV